MHLLIIRHVHGTDDGCHFGAERGKIAAWIAPPRQGINGKPFDYEYVHLA